MGFLDDVDPVLYYLGLSGILKYTLHVLWKDKKPDGSKLVGHITGLNIYPVKSGRHVAVDTLQCSSARSAHKGSIGDRHFMIVNDKNGLVTGRQKPELLGIVPKLGITTITLTAKNMPDYVLDTKELDKKAKQAFDVLVHMTMAKAVDCGQGAADWLAEYLGAPHRMLYSPHSVPKRVQTMDHMIYREFTKETKDIDLMAFHDSAAFHLITEKSLNDLNSRLENPVEAIRFRPNFVVKTTCAPYEEDEWLEVSIGETRFKKFKCADRCILPTIDPYTCRRDKTNEPQKTLKSYRKLPKGIAPIFGIDMVVEKPGTVKVGDPVYVTINKDNTTKSHILTEEVVALMEANI